MATFLAFAAVMIAAALSFVLVPLLRRPPATSTAGDSARRLRMLDQARAAGILEENEYAAKRAMLEKKTTEAVTQPTPGRRSRAAFAALLAVALLLPASALLLYRLVGTPQALDPANLAPPPGAEHTAADMEQAIAGLAAKLTQNPDDAQGWALLGSSVSGNDRAAESRDAFKQAHEHAPDDADIAVEYAQALAVASPDHRLDGEPRTLLENVLKKDPKNQRALWLIGISDYQIGKLRKRDRDVENPVADALARFRRRAQREERNRRRRSASRWPRTASPRAGTDRNGRFGKSDARFRKRRGRCRWLAGSHRECRFQRRHAPPHGQRRRSIRNSKTSSTPSATLFVFARAESGPPMPLAIKRLKAGELPTTVTLDDSMSMMPAMKLSRFPQVVVGARVSKSGNAMPQSGDLQALSPPIASSRSEPIALEINQVVP